MPRRSLDAFICRALATAYERKFVVLTYRELVNRDAQSKSNGEESAA